MIIVMKSMATQEHIDKVEKRLVGIGCEAHISVGQARTVIGAIGDREVIQQQPWLAMAGVERAVPVMKPYKFVSREFQPEDTVIKIRSAQIGGGVFAPIAGPCAVETRDQLFETAEAVLNAGATIMRGDAFKPRTSPFSFQGLAEKGLQLQAEAREEFGLPFVAEVLDPRHVDLVAGYADMLRIGTRNMSNYALLSEVGRVHKPVMLKRGFTATIDEWLNAAEYIYKEGNHEVVLVERGIRTFETATRNTLDISAPPVIKHMSHLPVIIDPSHSSGHRHLVDPLARAAIAVGADGFIIDVHPRPETALVDGDQALLPGEFAELMDQMRRLAEALGVTI